MAPVALDLCVAYMIRGDFPRIMKIAPEVLKALESTHREKDSFGARYNVYVGLHGFYGLALGYAGRFEEAKIVFGKARRAGIDFGYRSKFGGLAVQSAHVAFFEGDADNTVAYAQEGVRYYEETQNPYSLAQVLFDLALGWWLKGNFREAMGCAQRGLKIGTEIGQPFLQASPLWAMGLAQCGLGDKVSAMNNVEEALKVARNGGVGVMEGPALTYLGLIAAMEPSDRDAAEDYMLRGIKAFEERGARAGVAQGYLLLGELQLDAGQRHEAIGNLKKAEGLYLEMGVCPESVWLRRAREGLAKVSA
jgi:tetratricopeptide (TPR) repeat protein